MKTDRISRFIIDQVSLYDIEIKTEILILFLNSSIFIILEKFETEVLQRRLLEDLAVGKYIEIPLVKIVHQLDQIGPHPRVQVHNLPQAFLLLLYLVLI